MGVGLETREERRNNETISHAAGPFTAASTKRGADATTRDASLRTASRTGKKDVGIAREPLLFFFFFSFVCSTPLVVKNYVVHRAVSGVVYFSVSETKRAAPGSL